MESNPVKSLFLRCISDLQLFPPPPPHIPHTIHTTHTSPPHTPHTPYSGVFVMEYCGEVCTPADFEQRKKDYVKEKRRHYYFMSLKTDQVYRTSQYMYIVSVLLVYC